MLYRKLTIAAVGFALVIGILAIGSFSAEAAKTVKYEYQLIGMHEEALDRSSGDNTSPLQPEFDSKGNDGWEYVGTIPGKGDIFFLVFRK
jgi:hypothetical protein